MPGTQIQREFQITLIVIITFMALLALAARRRWLSSREFVIVGIAMVLMGAFDLMKLSMRMSNQLGGAPMHQILIGLGLTAPFTLSVSLALYFVWKRLRADELAAANQPKARPTTAQAPVSASELRKRKKKRL